MNFDFMEVLTRAWKITWKYKVLWIFGILAGCGRGSGGGNSGGNSGSGFDGGMNPGQYNEQFQRVGEWFNENTAIVIALACVLVLLGLAFMALGFIGRIALIKGAAKGDRDVESLAFGELWSESLPYFWRVFGLSLLVGLAILVVIAPFILVGVLTAGVGFACLLPLICVLIPVALIVSVVLEQATTAIVLEDLGMIDGLKRGWEVVKASPGSFIVMALILGMGGGVIGLIIALPIIIGVMPIIFGAASEVTAAIWAGVACICAYLPVIFLLNGILTTFTQTTWTLTFMRLTKPKPETPVIITANA